MTKPHNYLPGDRVINSATGILCTVKETPAERVKFGNPEYVYLDGDEGPDASYPFHNVHHTNLKPAPITVGAWVRVTDEFPKEINTARIGEVFKIERMDGEYTYHTKSGISHMWKAKHLRAVAEPAIRVRIPIIGTVKQIEELTGKATVDEAICTIRRQRIALQIADNARLDAIGQRDELQAQITKLADWITGEPSQSAVDTAIRIMTEQRGAITEAAKLLDVPGYPNPAIRNWLLKHAPQPKPAFKRGDLVYWGDKGKLPARIVTLNYTETTHEVMLLEGICNGEFRHWPIADLRHVAK